MLVVMLSSSLEIFQSSIQSLVNTSEPRKQDSVQSVGERCKALFAVPQLVLTCLAITNFHVQIITRIASGYPLLYLWVASRLGNQRQVSIQGRKVNLGKIIVRGFIIYGLVQGGLFASFLPPA